MVSDWFRLRTKHFVIRIILTGTRCRFPRRLMLLLLLKMIHCRAGKYLCGRISDGIELLVQLYMSVAFKLSGAMRTNDAFRSHLI